MYPFFRHPDEWRGPARYGDPTRSGPPVTEVANRLIVRGGGLHP
jgi:hypothetical protein